MTSSSSTNESSEQPPQLGDAGVDPVRRGRRRRLRSSWGARLLERTGLALSSAVLVMAPLAAGGVHRLPLIVLLVSIALGISIFCLSLMVEGGTLRVPLAAAVPLFFLLIPILQSVPMPARVRGVLDRNGNALLDDNPFVAAKARPMSLDPPSTRAQVGKAAAGLAIFLMAFHVASGQRRRHLLPRLIGATGIAAVAIGLGHRIFSVGKVYGMFVSSSHALLAGPFVNYNHNAEFLELATAACLACSFQRASALNRIGWLTGVFLCAVGVVGTLSRGGAIALAAGTLMFFFLRYRAQAGGSGTEKRRALPAWSMFFLGLVVLTAGALGAGQLVERFHSSALTTDVRLKLWWDSLRVLAAHPLGIGRGAFGTVYPVYRTIVTPLPLRFTFVENEPLQWLLEAGWLLYLGIAAGMALLVWSIVRQGRRDVIEAALVSGLFAVMTHSFLDFGLETLGVLLPFMATLGMVLGRSAAPERAAGKPLARFAVATAIAGALFGGGAVAHASFDDFDALLRNTVQSDKRRQLMARAQRAHPVDYFYVLNYARTEPLRPGPGGISPRLHTLNRALRLCPSCELVHQEVARNLWALSLRSQSLVEWRTAVSLQPFTFRATLGELAAAGAKPEELAALAAFDPKRMIDVANFLIELKRVDAAVTVLDQADVMGAPRDESVLTRARLQVQGGHYELAQATLADARALGIQDPRLVVLNAQVVLATQGAAGADQAMAMLDAGALRYPLDLELQRYRMDTVVSYEKWHAADRALEGLKMALYNAQGSAGEAHVVAARIQGRLGHWSSALSEYRMALAATPAHVWLWYEFGQAAENAGRDAMAREAYAEAARISPSIPQFQAALRRLDERQTRLRTTPDRALREK